MSFSTLPRFPTDYDRLIEEAYADEFTMVRTSSDGRLWRVMLHPLKDVSSTVVGHLIILHDISEASRKFSRLLTVTLCLALVLSVGLICFLYV